MAQPNKTKKHLFSCRSRIIYLNWVSFELFNCRLYGLLALLVCRFSVLNCFLQYTHCECMHVRSLPQSSPCSSLPTLPLSETFFQPPFLTSQRIYIFGRNKLCHYFALVLYLRNVNYLLYYQ